MENKRTQKPGRHEVGSVYFFNFPVHPFHAPLPQSKFQLQSQIVLGGKNDITYGLKFLGANSYSSCLYMILIFAKVPNKLITG